MQREKYNLDNKTYCNCFKKKENSIRSIVVMPENLTPQTLFILKTKNATIR